MSSKNKSGNGLKRSLLIGIILIIAGLTIPTFIFIQERKYSTGGDMVECIITETTKTHKSRRASGTYISKDGLPVEAKVVNAGTVAVNETIEGYVMPDDPDVVHVPCSMALWLIVGGISILLAGAGTYMIFSGVKESNDSRCIEASGIMTEGTIMSTRRDGSDRVVFYVSKVRYTDENGTEQYFEDYSKTNRYRVGDRCKVRYARKKNGKLAAEIV